MHQMFLDKLFVKNKMSLTVPTLQLVCVFPSTGKSSEKYTILLAQCRF